MPEERKVYYVALSKKILSYDGVNAEIGYDSDTYSYGEKELCKIGIADKTLILTAGGAVYKIYDKQSANVALKIIDRLMSENSIGKK